MQSDKARRFGANLTLVLKALSLSRGRLAAAIGVDKSVAGRWCTGAVAPSAHNLEAVTRFVAAQAPGFTMLDWDLPTDALAARFGVAPVAASAPVPSAIARWLAQPKVAAASTTTSQHGEAIGGLWRTTRVSAEMPGKFFHDHVLFQPQPDGALLYRTGALWARFEGWAMTVGDQLFCCGTGEALGTMVFSILNRPPGARADAMDGVCIARMADAGGVAVAFALYVERIGDLSGDPAADRARFEQLAATHQLAAEGSVPARIRDHLFRDIGPRALADGGDAVIMMRAMTSLARSHDGSPAPHLRAVAS